MPTTPPEAGPTAPTTPTRRSARSTTVAAGVGTIIEWYDYGLYGIVAGLVIAPLFFPAATGTVGLLATFATFAVGFIARPIGGIVLGALADRIGRRPVLMLSIVLIGVPTVLIGALPTYAVIGVWAPILLVVLRLAQGFGAGAELAGAITLLNESATRRRKGFYASFAMATGLVGMIVATLLYTAITASVSPEAFLSWGWRLPFLLSAVLTVVAIMLRRRMDESPEFARVQIERDAGRAPEARTNPLVAVWQSFLASPRNWFAGFLIPAGLNGTAYVMLTFGIGYLTNTVGLPRSQSLVVNLSMLVSGSVLCVLWGQVCDRIGAKRVMYIGIVGAVLLAFPYFAVLKTGNLALIIVTSVVMFAFAWSAGSAGHTVLMPALFKAEYRTSGLFSSREIHSALIAGPAPFLAAALVVALGGQPWLVAGLVIVTQLLTAVALMLGRPFVSREELDQTPALRGVTARD